MNHLLKESSGDEPITLERYVAFAYFGEKDIEDLDDQELQHVAQEFEEALAELRGDDE
jgi:hypothetical protein